LLALSVALFGCTSQSYEAGDGNYSYLRADFVELHAGTDKQVDYIDTDEGERLVAAEPFTASWITTADSVYRALLYYNKVETTSGENKAETVSVGSVPVLRPLPRSRFETVKTDPVTFESGWLSANKKYVNIAILLKTGTPDDDDAVQTLGLIKDSVTVEEDGTRCVELTLYHNQGSVPEYYSSRKYLSVRTSDLDADAVRIRLNTYSGEMVKLVSLH